MKLNIVRAGFTLLFVAQVAVATPYPDGTTNEVEAVSGVETTRLDPLISLTRIIKNFPEEIRNAVAKSQGSGIAVVDNSLQAILDNSDDALREIQRLVDDITDEINTDEASKKCNILFRQNNQEEMNNFYDQVRICGDEAREKIIESVTVVVSIWEEIVQSVRETIDEVQQCLDQNNLMRIVTCGVQEILEAKLLYFEKLGEFSELVSEELLEIVEISRSTFACIQEAYEEKAEIISRIDSEISKCQDVETD